MKHSAEICTVDNIGVNSELLKIRYNFECTESFGRNKVINKFNGRKKPVADIGDSTDRTLNISFSLKAADDITKLKAMEDSDKILFYKDNRGRNMYCTINPNSLKLQNKKAKSYSISLELVEVDYTEGG